MAEPQKNTVDNAMKTITPAVRAAFQEHMLQWFATHKRDLPWRAEYTPYHTWIAEVMMQQTQMNRGVAYFNRWMRSFPDISSVAGASEEALLLAWEGLGYYRRVRFIQAAAKVVMAEHGGVFPHSLEAIRALPGVGEYTAAAIASTAFQVDVAAVDGNVERVLTRAFDVSEPVRSTAGKRRIRALAFELLPRGKAREFNQALMELGALVCKKKPECKACPLAQNCRARAEGTVADRPVTRPQSRIIPVSMSTGILLHAGKIFVQRRLPDDRVWAGLWEFPGGVQEEGETAEQAVAREFMEETGFRVRVLRPLGVIKHGYTSYRLTMRCFELALEDGSGAADVWAEKNKKTSNTNLAGLHPAPVLTEACDWRWVNPDEFIRLPMPAPHRKLAQRYGMSASGQGSLFAVGS